LPKKSKRSAACGRRRFSTAVWIDALGLTPGARVLHVGCGLGYYTAVMAHCVGPAGRVVAVDIDEALAASARANLASTPWVDVRAGDGRQVDGESFDAILVNAGVTHPETTWLDALTADGRLLLPLTCAIGAMGPIGKGVVIQLTKRVDTFDAAIVTMVAIYSAIGIRDPDMNNRLGDALKRNVFPAIKRLRRDAHDQSLACWLHGPAFCLSA
jgi:protein-L-isoaspartate(D-aspartate) O-methyltransferase